MYFRSNDKYTKFLVFKNETLELNILIFNLINLLK
jgi:hypothetical protein